MNRTEYAKRWGVTGGAVSNWIAKGWVVIEPETKLVNVEISDRNLQLFRNAHDGRRNNKRRAPPPVAVPEGVTPVNPAEVQPIIAPQFQPTFPLLLEPPPPPNPPPGTVPAEEWAPNGAAMSRDEAERVKANFLALKAKHDHERALEQTVDVAAVKTLFFELSRAAREAWLRWPADAAPLIAADLGFENVDLVVQVLTAHVHEQLTRMGDMKLELPKA